MNGFFIAMRRRETGERVEKWYGTPPVFRNEKFVRIRNNIYYIYNSSILYINSYYKDKKDKDNSDI